MLVFIENMINLSERQRQLLKAIIELYVKTGEPIASESIEKAFVLGVSPATIRNEMVKLTDLGFLKQPHVSAGRIPTSMGFRLYINELMNKRIEASKVGDLHLSQAIKILMNSFYGVMGSSGCRFYHPHLPSAITGTGKWLLLKSKEYLHKQGYEVIYGDTDSLFIKLKEDEGVNAQSNGERIASELNGYWRKRLKADYEVTSFLELEFEKYYSRFILTPLRGGEQGAKKRYTGLLKINGEEEIEFVGMEFVRSDWTKLAKEFQVQLYLKIFNGEEIADWLRSIVHKVNRGAFDDKLVYRKRLRKEIDEYQKSSPPHVRAARMINKRSGTVEYVITKRGPVPIELTHGDLDYQHYIEKQLKPIADSVLGLLGESFDSIIKSPQLDFFD